MKTFLTTSSFIAVAAIAAAQNPAVPQANTTQAQRDTDKVLRDFQPGDSLPPLYSDEDATLGRKRFCEKKSSIGCAARGTASCFTPTT